MTMTPSVRRFALTVHVSLSVGWLGAVLCSLVLAVAALVSSDARTGRGVFPAMELLGWAVLVPLSLAALLTGLIGSLGTAWGLFRHYWVLMKLLINLVAAAILLLYMQTLGDLAAIAAEPATANSAAMLRNPAPVVHAVAALLALVAATVLSVYKPRGMTRYGQRRLYAGWAARGRERTNA